MLFLLLLCFCCFFVTTKLDVWSDISIYLIIQEVVEEGAVSPLQILFPSLFSLKPVLPWATSLLMPPQQLSTLSV